MENLKNFKWLAAGIVLFSFFSCSEEKKESQAEDVTPLEEIKETPVIRHRVVGSIPHDSTNYTEGFLFYNGQLYESTGAPSHLHQTHSSIGVVDQKTGKFDSKVQLDKKIYFGEGITILNNQVYQLTYTNQVGFIYDVKNFNSLGQFGYQNKEGWGMTTDGKSLIFSDGSSSLTYMDPETFKVTRTLEVTENSYGLYSLNELEYINGYIYANIWMTNRIVKIDPNDGKVVGALDLSDLTNEMLKGGRQLNELNGIAYDAKTDRILVTGKLWPKIFEISFDH